MLTPNHREPLGPHGVAALEEQVGEAHPAAGVAG